MNLDSGDLAGLIGAGVTMLGVLGGGIKWAFASRSRREAWLEARIQSHVANVEARLVGAERRADQLGFAFQLVAVELAGLDPHSDVLHRAQAIIGGLPAASAAAPAALSPPLDLTALPDP